MAVRNIRLFGDPVLRKISQEVGGIGDGIEGLMDDLADTVDAASGLGLAAPQIGVLKRVVVVVEVDGEGRRTHHVVANPRIVSACGTNVNEEGCLSLPGIYAQVKRPQSVVVAGMDRRGKEVTLEASGLAARAFVHEIDHLVDTVYP